MANPLASIKKRPLVFATGGAAAILVFILYRKRQASATGPDTTSEDTSLTDQGYGTDGFTGAGGGNFGAFQPTPDTGPVKPQTNAQWVQAVEEQMTWVDTGTLSAALGRYVMGLPVTKEQEGLIDQAIANDDYPPVRGQDGYPPAIRHGATTPRKDKTYKVPSRGQTPSLDAVAGKLGVSVKHIIAETNKHVHGPGWYAYLGRHNYRAPLPHGTVLYY